MTDVWTLLQERRRAEPGAPVVTATDPAEGVRTELSAASLENAAAKIANALVDEFDLDAGARVAVHLPLHWQRAAWCAGIWTAGCVLLPEGSDADLIVAGPSSVAALAGTGPRVVVVSLHPFGLPVTEDLPTGIDDATLAVRQQPDAYLGPPPSAQAPALAVGDDMVDQASLLERSRGLGDRWGLAAGGRLLVDARVTGVEAWLAPLAVPLACRGSVVLAPGVLGAEELARVRAQERVTALAS